MKPLAPALQYSEGRSRNWSGATLVNAFAEKADGDKRADLAVMATPGLTVFAEAGDGPIRGGLEVAGVLYVVSGNSLLSVGSDGTVVALADIGGSGPVRMASNYTQLCIAADRVGYVYSDGALSAPLPYQVSDVAYMDGYIIWAVADSEQFIISGLDEALSYDGADIASVEGAPDGIVGMINDHRELQFYGQKTTEIFYNAGGFDMPFERQGNAFIERGCFDRDSIVKIDNTVMFVGDDRIVYALAGYQPQRVSTHAIEYRLRDATYARGFTYSQEGHQFYCLECNAGTFVYDRATGAWHKRQSYQMDAWRVVSAFQAYGKTFLGDRHSGKIYVPSLDVLTEDGRPIIVEAALPTIETGRIRAVMNAFEVVCETGVGNDQVADPQIMLRYSDDGGHLWSNEMWRSMGRVGQYRTRAIWRKLGQFRNRQIELRISDPARKFIISYYADIT